jgi:hypothetical protein
MIDRAVSVGGAAADCAPVRSPATPTKELAPWELCELQTELAHEF